MLGMLKRIITLSAVIYLCLYYKGILNLDLLMEVPLGHIAIEYNLGKLSDHHHPPGFLLLNPLSTYTLIHTNIQSVTYPDLPCGSREGIMLTFPYINIVYVLDPDSAIPLIRNFGTQYSGTLLQSKLAAE
jgi:hypothetical protein